MKMTLNLDSFNSEWLRRIGSALAFGDLVPPTVDPLQQLQEIIRTLESRGEDISELREIAERWAASAS